MNDDLRLIAFNLPQFHAIPENDRWWGQGFTDWTNVKKAKPLFPGHYQPHVPADDLGYYDMSEAKTRDVQAELAKQAGISGFCYFHYWFNGKLLLEKPLHDILDSGKPDFPFSLCWANEPWTRAWDARSGEILMDQEYSEQDHVAHMDYLTRFFKDPRYIRIDGKPLFLVYRSKKIPNLQRTLEIWREQARKNGVGELYLCRVESYLEEHDDPTAVGFDAAIEFQPDWTNLGDRHVSLPHGGAAVYSYVDVVVNMLAKADPAYLRFPCVTPSWDNTARKKNEAVIVKGSTPELYKLWLMMAVHKVRSKKAGEKIIFVNAWNEWGEGNHLEPDKKFGMQYIEATREALKCGSQKEFQILFSLFSDIGEKLAREKTDAKKSARVLKNTLAKLQATNELLSQSSIFQAQLESSIRDLQETIRSQQKHIAELECIVTQRLVR